MNKISVDFNGDGRIDTALVSTALVGGLNKNTVVNVDYGRGKFGQVISIPYSIEVLGIETGDWNDDGHIDIGVICHERGRERGCSMKEKSSIIWGIEMVQLWDLV